LSPRLTKRSSWTKPEIDPQTKDENVPLLISSIVGFGVVTLILALKTTVMDWFIIATVVSALCFAVAVYLSLST
jgi:hypothetical protein